MSDMEWINFENPPKSARPMVRWWWTGLEVEEKELIEELNDLDEAGFYGAEIQIFMIGMPWKLEKKNPERAAICHRFMQPYYYKMIKLALDEAKKRGMIIDLTIGSAWPAGGTHISKQDSLKVLLVGAQKVRGPKITQMKIPKIKKPLFYRLLKISKLLLGYNLAEYFKDDMELEAVVAMKPLKKAAKIKFRKPKTAYFEKNSIIDLSSNIISKSMVKWEVPPGRWQIFAFYKGPSGARPLLDCRSNPKKYGLVMDHLSSEAIKKHMDSHLGEGKNYFGEHFGKALRAFFTDSLELSSEWLWSDKFIEEFKLRRGYDITRYLPICFVPNRDNKYAHVLLGGDIPIADFKEGLGNRIRYDFELTISDLFAEGFCQTMTQWAENNGILNRIQAYGIRADTLKCFGLSDIPETEQLYAGGMIDFLKLAGSAGIIYNKPIITAESIVWNQRDYMTTPLKMKVAADRLFISGINQMIFHGFPHQNPNFDYPGYCGFSTPYIPKLMNYSSNFSRMNPFWEFFPLLNKYITRCQYVLQKGKTVCDIAIFYPRFNYNDSVLKKEELIGGYLDENDAPKANKQSCAHPKKKKKWDANDHWIYNMLIINDALLQNGYYYCHVNEESILNCSIQENQLIFNGNPIKCLIIPNVDSISLSLAIKLVALANDGGKIIFTHQLPSKQPGFLNYKENDKKIKALILQLIESGKAYFIKDNQDVIDLVDSRLGIEAQIKYQFPQPSIQFIHKITENIHYYLIRNSNNTPQSIIIELPHKELVPLELNPWTGTKTQVIHYEKRKDSLSIKLFFEAYELKIIALINGNELIHSIKAGKESFRRDGKIIEYIEDHDHHAIEIHNWTLFVNIRHHNGEIEPFKIVLASLKDWREIKSLKYCSSKGRYESEFHLDSSHIQENLIVKLSLERIHDVAVIKINQHELPPLLIPPYELEITPYVREGDNDIIIEITPTIRNRLIGYGRKGGKAWKNHKKKKEFMPSGVIGHVLIKFFSQIE